MYRKQVRRRRAILVLLVVACLMLISISVSEADSGPLKSVQDGLSSVLSPVQEGADRALKPLRDMVDWFDETFEARGENEELHDQVATLQQEKLDLLDAAEDAGYLKTLEKLVAENGLESYQRVEASVLNRNFSVWYSTIVIDAGSSDGIGANDPVVTADGLIGRVASVTGGTAKVALITQQGNGVTGRIAGEGPVGLIVPVIGAPDELDFTLIQGDKEIEDGDEIVTAGFSTGEVKSRFPPNIPIGEVSEAIPAEQEQRQQVSVKPFADIADLDLVTVLTGGTS